MKRVCILFAIVSWRLLFWVISATCIEIIKKSWRSDGCLHLEQPESRDVLKGSSSFVHSRRHKTMNEWGCCQQPTKRNMAGWSRGYTHAQCFARKSWENMALSRCGLRINAKMESRKQKRCVYSEDEGNNSNEKTWSWWLRMKKIANFLDAI